MDKSSWPNGVWRLEPDKMLWIDSETGYECLIRRVRDLTTLCVYVGIQKDHPLHGTQLVQFRKDESLFNYFNNTHNNITMAIPCKKFQEEPGPDDKIGRAYYENLPEPTEIWYIGTDMINNYDVIPIISDDPNDNTEDRTYRDIDYAYDVVTKLAADLKKFKEDVETGKFKFNKIDMPLPAWAK